MFLSRLRSPPSLPSLLWSWVGCATIGTKEKKKRESHQPQDVKRHTATFRGVPLSALQSLDLNSDSDSKKNVGSSWQHQIRSETTCQQSPNLVPLDLQTFPRLSESTLNFVPENDTVDLRPKFFQRDHLFRQRGRAPQ
jgi:hypothetical protein